MSISECFGEFRTGKTQLAHTLCVTAQMPGMNHTGGKVAYIDTEGTFRPDRLRSIAARFNLDANAILNNIGSVRNVKNSVPLFHRELNVTRPLKP